ncbi:hypothetical protein [Candidatus Cyanaurora vandensis]|uniref:hypothetical protein n=1 Tax=Candidatus Cyanaurora vandensis TaxID=2714958 RepID=UPI00257D7FE9|nr:hypothetical protein [Candidatus Cyanaurora vandensis]
MNTLELLLALVKAALAALTAYMFYQSAHLRTSLAKYSQVIDKEAYIAQMEKGAADRQYDRKVLINPSPSESIATILLLSLFHQAHSSRS